jgi:hypothetical protein
MLASPKLGVVARQKLDSIREACHSQNLVLLTRSSESARSIGNTGLIGDMQCATCQKNLSGRGRVRETDASLCVLCGRQFCISCISIVDIVGDVSCALPSCKISCCRFLKRLQFELDPWHRAAASSKALYELENQVNVQHTQLCSRLSNFEGLARFFSENRNSIPREDILRTMPELERSVKQGVDLMAALIKKIQAVECPPYNEPVKRGLVNFCSTQLGKSKAQFHLSSSIYENLVNRDKVFSPRTRHPVRHHLSGPEIDLDSL